MSWLNPDAKGKRFIKWDGTLEAERFEGDGSALTGIAAGGGGAVYPLAIASGGTNANTAGDARTNLDVAQSGAHQTFVAYPLAQASGGTGATAALQVVYPLAAASGGTGATTALQVVYPIAVASGGTNANAFTSSALVFYNDPLTKFDSSAALTWFPELNSLEIDNGTTTAAFQVQSNNIARMGTITNNSFEFITNNNSRFKVTNTGVVQITDANLEMSGFNVDQLAEPSAASHAATKNYIDTNYATSGSLQTTTSDQSTSGAAFYAGIVYNTTSAGLTAGSFAIGSLLVVYE